MGSAVYRVGGVNYNIPTGAFADLAGDNQLARAEWVVWEMGPPVIDPETEEVLEPGEMIQVVYHIRDFRPPSLAVPGAAAAYHGPDIVVEPITIRASWSTAAGGDFEARHRVRVEAVGQTDSVSYVATEDQEVGHIDVLAGDEQWYDVSIRYINEAGTGPDTALVVYGGSTPPP